MKFNLDRWQKAVLEHEGDICIQAGRQVGKTTVVAMKAAQFAIKHPGSVVMVIAASQRQSSLLFDRIRGEIDDMEKKRLLKHVREPTMTRMEIRKVGQKEISKIHSLPAGRTGYFIRGFTVDLLIADEAAYIPEMVWRAVIPMIAVSRKLRKLGWVLLLSTPFGKGGYFYDSFHDPDFRQFHISSENCPRIPKDFLLKEKNRMTKLEYAQEYLGEFIDDYNQLFPTALIKDCMTFIEWQMENWHQSKRYYLGVDIARYGGDENAFVIAEMDTDKKLKIVKVLTTTRNSLTDTIGRIMDLDGRFKFRKIFIDPAGVGGGVMDVLIDKVGRRVIGLDNATRSVDKEGRKKRLLKEDMYSNALVLMETGRVQLISDLALLKSLKNIVFEYTAEKNLRIHGKYSHIAEAFVRSCWCSVERGLTPFIA